MLQKDELIDGKYRIVRPIGRGGMGVVYLGEHTRIKRQIAIKVLNKDVADADAVRRFEKEAQAAGAIGSEHIVEVIDLGTLPTGESFMVMEYLEGETLRQRIKERPLSPDAAAVIFDQLLEGLVAAHAVGIVHRDLKPDNVFLAREKSGRREFVKILDFGISKFASTDDQSMQTRTGTVMGTPVYMSPEQVKSSHSVDARSDVYSAGVILFQALTGKLPFSAGAFHELLFKIVYEDPLSPMQAAPQLDPAVGAIISKAMARDAKDRYPTARALQTALALWRADSAKVSRVSADLSVTPAAGLGAFIDSARTGAARHEPVELAPTEMSPSERGRAGEAPAPASMPSMPSATTNLAPLETQKSWSPGSLHRSNPRRSQWMMIGIGATLTVLVGGLLVLRLREPAATPAAPEQSGVVLPVSATVAAVEPTIAPAPAEPPLSPPEQPAASASASASASTSAATATPPAKPGRTAPRGAPAGAPRPATTAAAKPGEPDKAPRPSGTVSDFGY